MSYSRRSENRNRKRGVVMAMVAMTMIIIIGFGALTIDVGYLYNVRADLQNAADAAALTGVSALTSDLMTNVRSNRNDTASLVLVKKLAIKRAQQIALKNPTLGLDTTQIGRDGVRVGWIDLDSGDSVIRTDVPVSQFNAVAVRINRTSGSVNGSVSLFFSSVLGFSNVDVSAYAVATFDDRIIGVNTQSDCAGFLPITMDINQYTQQMATGGDLFSYDESIESVTTGADSTNEVIAFPDEQAPGNYGLLNIGLSNQSLTSLSAQVEGGVSPEDFDLETGSNEIYFFDSDGQSTSFSVSGNTGLKASLETSFDTLVGKVVALFVHDSVVDNGTGATYNIVGVRWVRVMDVNLQDAKANRGLWLQPVAYTCDGVIVDNDAPSSAGVAGKIMLVR